MCRSCLGWDILPIHKDTRGILSWAGVLGCFQFRLDLFRWGVGSFKRVLCDTLVWKDWWGGMERKKVNNPGVSLGCSSPQCGLLTMPMKEQGCLRVSCQMHGPKKWATYSSLCSKLEFWDCLPNRTLSMPMGLADTGDRPFSVERMLMIVIISNLSKSKCTNVSSKS